MICLELYADQNSLSYGLASIHSLRTSSRPVKNVSKIKMESLWLKHQKWSWRISLVAQSIGTHLPMQETQVQPLVQKEPKCQGAVKPVRRN